MKKKKEALQLLEESLKELESQKGSILTAIQKLSRVSKLLDKENIIIWCEIQFGNTDYTLLLEKYIEILLKRNDENNNQSKEETDERIKKYEKKLEKVGICKDIYTDYYELTIKHFKEGGGYKNIGYIEERYADLVRMKKGNSGTYYKNHLSEHINYVKKKAHQYASDLYNEVKFSDTVSNCFYILKIEVDDRLLDLNPEIAEQLMLAFKAVSSNKKEEWSHALTSCRRLLEGLADELLPATDKKIHGRILKQSQYINRL